MIFKIGQTFNKNYPPQAAIWCNENNAHIVKNATGFIIKSNHISAPSIAELINTQQEVLNQTDYKVIKAFEKGESIEESTKTKRQAARDEINRLRALLEDNAEIEEAK